MGEVIAFAQMSFWLVIYNDPEAHGAADDAAGERIFSRADSDTRNHAASRITRECVQVFEFRLEKEKRKKSG